MKKFVFPYAGKDGTCHDCGVLPGQWHYEGCDVEACPYTFKQRLSCDCGKCLELEFLVDKIPFGFEIKNIREAITGKKRI